MLNVSCFVEENIQKLYICFKVKDTLNQVLLPHAPDGMICKSMGLFHVYRGKDP